MGGTLCPELGTLGSCERITVYNPWTIDKGTEELLEIYSGASSRFSGCWWSPAGHLPNTPEPGNQKDRNIQQKIVKGQAKVT